MELIRMSNLHTYIHTVASTDTSAHMRRKPPANSSTEVSKQLVLRVDNPQREQERPIGSSGNPPHLALASWLQTLSGCTAP